MNNALLIRIYDGAHACASCSKCPVIDLLPEGSGVVIHDPSAPERGSFQMSVEEFENIKNWFKTQD